MYTEQNERGFSIMMLFNYIRTSIPHIYLIERVDGYKIVEFYGDDFECLGGAKTKAEALAIVERFK